MQSILCQGNIIYPELYHKMCSLPNTNFIAALYTVTGSSNNHSTYCTSWETKSRAFERATYTKFEHQIIPCGRLLRERVVGLRQSVDVFGTKASRAKFWLNSCLILVFVVRAYRGSEIELQTHPHIYALICRCTPGSCVLLQICYFEFS